LRATRPSLHLKENRNNQDRDDVDDLDHWIDCRTGCVLVKIADRVAGRGPRRARTSLCRRGLM
jgi:hypothetical protein